MPEVSRRGLLVIALLLAVVGAVGSYSIGAPATVVAGKTLYRGHSSPAPPETTTTTTIFSRTTTTTTTFPAVNTTTVTEPRSVVTTTTTVLAVSHPTTTLVPTTPCTWSTETFPQLNGTSPTLFVHITAPAMPNSTVAVRLFPHGGSAAQASQIGSTDGAGHVNVVFPVTVAQLGTQVDLTAQVSAGGGTIACSPKLYTATLTPLL